MHDPLKSDEPDPFTRRIAMAQPSTKAQGDAYERHVQGLLELLGFEVQRDRLVAGRQTDLIARREAFPETQTYLVECKHYRSPVTMKVVEGVENRLKAARRKKYPDARGWIVAAGDFARKAHDYADSLGILCNTDAELTRRLIDFRPYLHDLILDYEEHVVDRQRGLLLPQLYVEPDALIERKKRADVRPLQELLDEWLADPALNQLTLLGDYGTGKTVFTLKLAHDLAQACCDGPSTQLRAGYGTLIPVRIPLKEFDPKQQVDDLVMNHLRRHGIEGSPYRAFQYLLCEGLLLLILDGFDEITAQVTPELTGRNFEKLDALVSGRAKVLLTCRTHYFRDRPEVEALLENRAALAGMETREGTELYQLIVGRPNYRILYLREFDQPKIIAYLQKACGDEWKKDWETIQSIYNLEELARRPVLLDIVVKSLPELRRRGGEVTPAGLYQVYTNFWIERDDWRAILTPAGKAAFTTELAWRLWTANRERLHYAELTDLAQELLHAEHFKPGAITATQLSQADIEYAAHEVRTAAFLTRDAGGNYGFAHRSFVDFFVARRLCPQLVAGTIEERTIGAEVAGFLNGLLAGRHYPYQEIKPPEGFVYVPPGPFIFGEGAGTRIAKVADGFFIGKYPVTNAEYRPFVEAGGYDERRWWSDEGWAWRTAKPRYDWHKTDGPDFWGEKKYEDFNSPEQPVVGVTWYEAQAYARWLSETVGREVRLPTEEEWEKAARGIDGRRYPWGNAFDAARCNTDEGGIGHTTAAGQYSPAGDSVYGAADMAGNVWEWTASWHDVEKTFRVLRGGSWGYLELRARCSFRDRDLPGYSNYVFGFRLVSPVLSASGY
jgi:formylglycine-generating enzyme required for sulfatase activity